MLALAAKPMRGDLVAGIDAVSYRKSGETIPAVVL
jgi:hypothetical protein